MFKVLAENEMKPHKTGIFKLIFKQNITLILWSGVQPIFSPSHPIFKWVIMTSMVDLMKAVEHVYLLEKCNG